MHIAAKTARFILKSWAYGYGQSKRCAKPNCRKRRRSRHQRISVPI